MEQGDSVHVISTDSGAVADVRVFAVQTGHLLVRSWDAPGEFHFVPRKSEK